MWGREAKGHGKEGGKSDFHALKLRGGSTDTRKLSEEWRNGFWEQFNVTPCPPYSSRSTHPPLLGPAAAEACQAGEGPEETGRVFEAGLSLPKRASGEILKEARLWPCVPRQVPTASHLCELRVWYFWDLETQRSRSSEFLLWPPQGPVYLLWHEPPPQPPVFQSPSHREQAKTGKQHTPDTCSPKERNIPNTQNSLLVSQQRRQMTTLTTKQWKDPNANILKPKPCFFRKKKKKVNNLRER